MTPMQNFADAFNDFCVEVWYSRYDILLLYFFWVGVVMILVGTIK